MSEDFLATVAKEGSDPFATLEKDTPAESPAETKPEVDKPEEGDNTPKEEVPFHKHPRWIEREAELKAFREREETTARELAELKTFKEETTKRFAPTSTKVPDWFKELYGENESAWLKYSEREAAREQEIEQRLIEKQELAQRQQAEEANHWNKWVDSEIEKLQSEGITFDRNKLIKTMLDFRPTDEQGNFDFRAGLKIYQALEGKDDSAIQARKELADTAMKASSKGDRPKKDYMTPADLRNRSWSNIV